MKNLLLIISALLFIMVPTAAESGSLEAAADIPSVPIYIDNTFLGVTPLVAPDIPIGYHLVQASPDGFFSQTQNISVGLGEVTTISFTFMPADQKQIPAMVRIGECVGTPEPSDLDGPAYDILRLSDGTLMAYYSGWEEGILCMASADGISWERIPGSCLAVPMEGKVFRTEPWVSALPDGSYRMIFRQTSGNQHSLFSAVSYDGRIFSEEKQIVISGDSEMEMPGYPSVPTGVLYADGTTRMYYSVPGLGIKSAISEDMGISWKQEDGVRLRLGTDPTVTEFSDGRTGIFYVDTTPKSKGQRIFFSLSDDGLDFSQFHPVQVMETTEPGIWLMDPEVIEEDDTLYLYFSVMGIEGMQNYGLPGTHRSIVDPDCMANQAML